MPDSSFDRVLSLYALYHFPNPDRALAEMCRVLRPGGTLVLAVGSGPPLPSLAALSYLIKRLPLFVQELRGRWLVAPAFLNGLVAKHLASSSDGGESEHRSAHRVSAASLPKLIGEAGFVEPRSGSIAELATLSTADEFWELQVTFSSIARKRIQSAPQQQVDGLEREFQLRCREIQDRGGRLTYPYGAYWVRARRPAAPER